MAYTWNLTEEDEKQLENSESGDTLYIETPMLPLLFKEDEGIGIPIFTCETEISAEYRNEYALQKCDLDYVLKLAKAIKKVTKQDVILDIDSDSDEVFTFDKGEKDIAIIKSEGEYINLLPTIF